VLLSLVDSMRCPAAHAASPLVLSADAWSGTRVMSGVLGCPVCHARYPIENGVVDFTSGSRPAPAAIEGETDATRLAAQLGLAEAGGIVLLTGRYASGVAALLELVDVTCVLVDELAAGTADSVTFRIIDRLPLVDNALRAAAVDHSRANAAFLADVVRCVRPGGRLVVPISSSRPETVRILARDSREWVGEVESTEPLTPLRRVTR
jgi:uncharacterized protein YbaR (Trm112 family)